MLVVEEGDDDDDDNFDDEPPMFVDTVAENSIYSAPTPARPDAKACIICPGKALKNEHMVEVHLRSGVSAGTTILSSPASLKPPRLFSPSP